MKEEVRIILVGESACGKTKLINRFINNKYTKEYNKTGFDKLETNIQVDQKSVKLTIWDTSGLASYAVLRPLVYRESDVALVCYKLDGGVPTIQNWLEEVWRVQPLPVVLAGCAMDSVDQQVIDECSSLPESLGLDGCITSAKTGFNTSLVFQLCVRAAIHHIQKENVRHDNITLGGRKSTIRRPLTTTSVTKRPSSVATTTSIKPTRPTSLKINDSSPGQLVLRTISQKQKQLRLGVSSLVMGNNSNNVNNNGNNVASSSTSNANISKTESKLYISRNTCCSPPNLFSPYSPHSSRTSMLLNSNTAAMVSCANGGIVSRSTSSASGAIASSAGVITHAAQIQPNRLTSRQSSRPCSRATAIPVPPPTSPGCDNTYAVIGGGNGGISSPTSSLLSGPFSPTSSVMSGFPPLSEVSISSPFPGLLSDSRQSGHIHMEEGKESGVGTVGGHDRLGSDIESVSSHSQADSVSLRGSRIPWLYKNKYGDHLPSSKSTKYGDPTLGNKQKDKLLNYADHSNNKHKVFCDPKPERCSIM